MMEDFAKELSALDSEAIFREIKKEQIKTRIRKIRRSLDFLEDFPFLCYYCQSLNQIVPNQLGKWILRFRLKRLGDWLLALEEERRI